MHVCKLRSKTGREAENGKSNFEVGLKQVSSLGFVFLKKYVSISLEKWQFKIAITLNKAEP